MLGGFPSNAANPSPGSWLDAWLHRRSRHRDEFRCGVRVVDGQQLAGESSRWTYRRSAVDPLASDGWITLWHGTGRALHLAIDPDAAAAGTDVRWRHVVLSAVERGSGARLELSVPIDEASRFGLDVQ